MDFSQLLAQKTDMIVKRWVEAVRQDRQIESADDLSPTLVQDHIPHVLAAMAAMLSPSQDSDLEFAGVCHHHLQQNVESLVKASLEHGVLRAEQSFEPAEIAREYRLLRQEILSALEAEFKSEAGAEVLRAVRMIDAVVDEAIGQCFKSYTDERLGKLQQLQSQLTLTNQELNRLVRAHQENLSHLAHELKNPLTSIIGYSDLFLRQQRNTELKDTRANLEHIERVLRNGRHLLRMLNDALEISRYQAGKMILQPTPIDVRTLINNAIEMLEPLARAKELQMKVDCDRAPDQVLTDSLRLQQIVTNLVSNAIRYTEAGTIELTCFVLPNDKWAIAVTDTGIGIAKEDQALIFEPYFRVGSNSNSYLPDSTGLGLAIVSQSVKLIQGKIELVSQVGVGSTFTVILPLEVKPVAERV
jgi:signal transduction histidine kinase